MKTVVFALLVLFGTISFSLAGPHITIPVGGGINRPVAHAVYCPPTTPLPAINYTGPSTSFYSWGPSVVVYADPTDGTFHTISPLLNYAGGQPVYQVPAPVLPVQPPTIYPSMSFQKP